jgi:hypothetical protein
MQQQEEMQQQEKILKNYIKIIKTSFICPHCRTKSKPYSTVYILQKYDTFIRQLDLLALEETIRGYGKSFGIDIKNDNIFILSLICPSEDCFQVSLLINNKFIIPENNNEIEPPHKNMHQEVKALYEEAASILNKSPRSSGVLIRAGLQRFLEIELGIEKGKGEIKKNLIELVKNKQLSIKLTKSADHIRLLGNDLTHGFEDVPNDSMDIKLIFDLLNDIYESISREDYLNQKYTNYNENKRIIKSISK